jgi:hypothetical protein
MYYVEVTKWNNHNKVIDKSVYCDTQKGVEMIKEVFEKMYDKNVYRLEVRIK